MSTVLTFGNFDGVHLGHLAIFSVVADFSKKLSLSSVAITFEPHPLIYFYKKNDFLIYTPEEKKNLIESFVDKVCTIEFNSELSSFTQEGFLTLLHSRFAPVYIITGPKCRFGRGAVGGISDLKKYEEKFGYKTVVVDSFYGDGILYSSTTVRGFLKNGQIEEAAKILGRNYSICGIVKKNAGIGKKIGFPTINIQIPKELIKPRFGVYFGEVEIGAAHYSGIINIGNRPTVSKSNDIFLEMHIFNFSQEVYGQKVRVFPLRFIRDEKKFSSIINLKEQIKADIELAKQQIC